MDLSLESWVVNLTFTLVLRSIYSARYKMLKFKLKMLYILKKYYIVSTALDVSTKIR